LSKQNFKRLSYEMVFSGDEDNPEKDRLLDAEELQKILHKKEQEFENKLSNAREKAHNQGYEQGFEDGKKEAEKMISRQLEPLRKGIEESREAVSEITNGIKPYMAELVFELTGKILRQPVANEKLRKETKAELSRVLEEVQGQLKIKIEISPADYDMAEQLVKAYRKESEIEIRKKENLNPGEYHVSTNKEVVIKEFRKILRDFKDHVAITNNEGEQI